MSTAKRRALPQVTLLHSGNALVVQPTTDRVFNLLAPALTYQKSEYDAGKRHGGSPYTFTDVECFTLDFRRRLATCFGYLERVTGVLQDNGYEVLVREVKPRHPSPPHPEAFVPRFDLLLEFARLRYRQDELLIRLASHYNGQFNAPPGFGKSKTVLFICAMFPHARILVTADPVAVVKNVLYAELVGGLPNVGIVGGGKRILGRRVMCATFDSLHHIDANWPDIVLIDECHQAASDGASSRLVRYNYARMYGLSATTEMRPDGSDLVTEGLCGPVRFFMSYQEALAHGLVGQIEVHWHSVRSQHNPCEGLRDPIERERRGIWRHEKRNKLIVAVAREGRQENESVLVTCRTAEHLAHLKALCPEAVLIHAEDDREQRSTFADWEGTLIPRQEPMTIERRDRLTEQLRNGAPGIYIITPILNIGFNAARLCRLVRAEGAGSAIQDTQVPGRVSRRNDEKSGGRVDDFLDEFDPRGYGRKAATRRDNYNLHGWKQIFPPAPVLPKRASRAPVKGDRP